MLHPLIALGALLAAAPAPAPAHDQVTDSAITLFDQFCLKKKSVRYSDVPGERIDTTSLTEPFASYFRHAIDQQAIKQGDQYFALSNGPTSMGGALETKCMVAFKASFAEVRTDLTALTRRQSEPDFPGSTLNGKLAMWLHGGEPLTLTSLPDGWVLLQSRQIYIGVRERN